MSIDDSPAPHERQRALARLAEVRRRSIRRRRFRIAATAVGVTVAAIAIAVPLALAGGPRPQTIDVTGQGRTTPLTEVPRPSATTRAPSDPSASTAGPGSPVPSGFVPQSFSAVSATEWWVLGTVPCGSRDCQRIEATTDGGAAFHPLPVPGGPFGPDLSDPPTVQGIRFADPEDGWAFGPALYATHDGGRHWTTIRMSGRVTDLEPGLGAVFAVVVPPSQACTKTGTCSRATPGSQLWRASPPSDAWTPDAAAGGVSAGLAVHGHSVWIIDSMDSGDGPAIGTDLLHSSDDGSHFETQPAPIPGIDCSYSPVSDTFVWSYCSGGHFMSAYLSSDAGEHFASVGPGQPPATTPNGYPNGSTLEAASPTIAVAADDLPGSPLVRTTDGGASWSAVQVSPDDSGVWSLIGFTTPTVGFAFFGQTGATYDSTTAQLWRTTDAGATWSAVPTVP